MFHTLHCVVWTPKLPNRGFKNILTRLQGRLRKLTPETLRQTLNSHNQRMHYHHCLSQIRQYVMCAGDMTPIPTRYYPSIGRNYVDSDMPHTCRNFDKLRDWLTGRYYSVDDWMLTAVLHRLEVWVTITMVEFGLLGFNGSYLWLS